MKYEEYPQITKGIEKLTFEINEIVHDKSMVADLKTVRVNTTSIATIEDGKLVEKQLTEHISSFYATLSEVINMDFISVRSRFMKDTIGEIRQYNSEFYKLLDSAGMMYDPSSGVRFIDWFIDLLNEFKKKGTQLSNIKWASGTKSLLLKDLKDARNRSKLMQWMDENKDFV